MDLCYFLFSLLLYFRSALDSGTVKYSPQVYTSIFSIISFASVRYFRGPFSPIVAFLEAKV